MNLGVATGSVGDYTSATTYFEDSLKISRTIGERRIEQMSIDNLGYLANLQHDYARASYYLEQSLDIARSIGNKAGIVSALINLGHVARTQHQRDDAIAHYREALILGVQIDAVPSALEALAGLADISDDFTRAIRWLGLVLNHAAASEETRKMAESELEELRLHTGLSEAEINACLDEGKALRLEEVAAGMALA
jgi:tetratricopeptide (TPR) repeat protein